MGEGVLEGTVIDSVTKQPIADVVVTATSTALPGGQVRNTNDAGFYEFPALPAGIYTLSMTAGGFRPWERGGIELHLVQTLRVNAELLPTSIG